MQAIHPLQQQARLFAELESKKHWRECYLICWPLLSLVLYLQPKTTGNTSTTPNEVTTLKGLITFNIMLATTFALNIRQQAHIQHQLGNAAPIQKQPDCIEHMDLPLMGYISLAVFFSITNEIHDAYYGLVESPIPAILKVALLGFTYYSSPKTASIDDFDEHQDITTELQSSGIVFFKLLTSIYAALPTLRRMYLEEEHPLSFGNKPIDTIVGTGVLLCLSAIARAWLKTSRTHQQYASAANNLIAAAVQPPPPAQQPPPAPQPPVQQPPVQQPPAPQPPVQPQNVQHQPLAPVHAPNTINVLNGRSR
ncbi:MAG: hypothetical protein P1U63_04560 [Coxiellaceae bacterium]|nr:hypothetical protein [Coxiellaceae bacterium]